MKKQGGIYARYSPGRDRDQTSTIEAQVAMYCEKAGSQSPTPLPFLTHPKAPRQPHFPDGVPPSTRFPRNTKSRGQGID